jgi:RNA polymerase sigma-70 factor (ECF subfamily)
LTTGEEAEFTELVRRQSRFVFRVAYAVLLNSHDAEDVVQEAFLKLYRNRGWQNLDNERAFLARVAWRVAVDSRSCSTRPAGPISEPDQAGELPCQRPGPEQTLLTANQAATVHSMIDTLPDELRVPLALSAFDELNSREIGGILGIPEGTVRTRLQRAREMLRKKLGALRDTRLQETRYV